MQIQVVICMNLRDRLNRTRANQEDEYQPFYPEEQEPQYYQPEPEPEEESTLPPKIQGSLNKATPLSILDEIKNKRIPKGTAPVLIQGIPVDLHSLEDYIISISPYNIKTLMRYNNARILEEIKGYSKFGTGKINSKMLILIMLAAGMAVLGIIMIMFMPQIMAMFQGGI